MPFYIPGNFVGDEFENAGNCLEQSHQNSSSAWAAGYMEILDAFMCIADLLYKVYSTSTVLNLLSICCPDELHSPY